MVLPVRLALPANKANVDSPGYRAVMVSRSSARPGAKAYRADPARTGATVPIRRFPGLEDYQASRSSDRPEHRARIRLFPGRKGPPGIECPEGFTLGAVRVEDDLRGGDEVTLFVCAAGG